MFWMENTLSTKRIDQKKERMLKNGVLHVTLKQKQR